jgi:3D (Asp-Asp-Asp) domain-containing protein
MRFKQAVCAGAVLVLALWAVIFFATKPAKKELDLTVPAAATSSDTTDASSTRETSSSTPTSSSTTSTTTAAPPPSPTTTSKKAPAAPQPPAGPTAKFVANAFGPITFFSARDNDPPGSRAIAFTNVLHKRAGGTGTFEDPLTLAAGNGQMLPGTKVYVPDVKRYFILEDICSSCANGHIDLWAGPATDNGVLACEDSLTHDGSRPYEVNPPPGLTVIPGDLYQNGRCFQL